VQLVEPEVRLIASPVIDWEQVHAYLVSERGESWMENVDGSGVNDAANLIEIAGRMCYKSWEPGLNPNVTMIRREQAAYIANIIASGHGSVLEHASFSLLLSNVSRVMTHEMVRHRAGVAVSQESLRYVRVTEIPFWMPDWAIEDAELAMRSGMWLAEMEHWQEWMTSHFALDDPGTSFSEKKKKTSFMRRFLPEGLPTQMLITANARALRHIIVLRTAPGAEEEIRLVAGKIAEVMTEAEPLLLGDIVRQDDGSWTTDYPKV
jgi:thymidylate synthase (FAD)